MKPSPFEYQRAHSLDEALTLLGTYGYEGSVLAGGQSLVALMNLRLAAPGHIIDIGSIKELAYIRTDEGAIAVGATVAQSEAEDSPVVDEGCSLLAAAIPFIAHREIRNAGTVVGSVAHADPAAEIPVVAACLDASVHVRSASASRTVAARDFFRGPLMNGLEPGELVEEVRFPTLDKSWRVAFDELCPRHGDYGIVSVAIAAKVDGAGAVEDCRIAFGGVGGTPVRASAAEAAVKGQQPTTSLLEEVTQAAADELDPVADLQGSADFRRRVAKVIALRAFHKALGTDPDRQHRSTP